MGLSVCFWRPDQEWAGSYEITGLGFDGFVAISWRINRVSDWKNIIAFIGG